jgi:copper chaperone CopZ
MTVVIEKLGRSSVGCAMRTIHLKLEGLQCGGCVDRVKNALLTVSGVRSANVQQDQATVELEGNQQRKLVDAVKVVGYKATITK